MTTDYVSDSHLVRWVTLWIYTFHMPAFIFISGLLHKQYITEQKAALGIKGETKLRADKVLSLRAFEQPCSGIMRLTKNAILSKNDI